MNQVFLVAIGGALGSVSRYVLGWLIKLVFPVQFPLSTLFVNIIGSFFIGLIFSSLQHHSSFPIIKPLIIIGLLGGFTTFSAFSFEVIELIETKQMVKALLYILLSNGLGITAAYLGYKVLA
ncbi:MAG: fluoride efflux transporter CrcB [Bacteroidota bacterium]|nr:fluoride efflux transporter CrcB [Bacteroidota bacterium]